MGFLSSITDTLFGDSGKAASKSQGKENEKNREFVRESVTRARGDIASIFPAVQESRQTGFDAARSIFGQSVPQAFNAFQGGNRAAQRTTAAAPQQQMNARLGQPVDFGFLQPQEQFTPDFSFLQPQQPQAPAQQPAGPQQPSVDIQALLSNPDFLASLGIGNEGGQGGFNGPGGFL